MSNKCTLAGRDRSRERGFSLLEMIVAMLILTIGLLGVASAIGYALMTSNSGRGLTNAKLHVVSALEQMETLRNSGQLNWGEIESSPRPAGSTFTGFLPGFIPVSRSPGADYVYGTSDDPGVTYPTDGTKAVLGVRRQIVITDLTTTLKSIQVTLEYSPSGGKMKTLVCTSYLNDDSHGNYVP